MPVLPPVNAWIWMSRILAGQAHFNLGEGRSGAITRDADGTWRYLLDGVYVTGFVTWEAALQDLRHVLANQGIHLLWRE